MLVLNFSHPVTQAHVSQLKDMRGAASTIRAIPAHFDHAQPFAPQVAALAPAAGCLLAEIHGRCGHFPALLRLSPVAGSVAGSAPTIFTASEVLDLQGARDGPRSTRSAPLAGQQPGQEPQP